MLLEKLFHVYFVLVPRTPRLARFSTRSWVASSAPLRRMSIRSFSSQGYGPAWKLSMRSMSTTRTAASVTPCMLFSPRGGIDLGIEIDPVAVRHVKAFEGDAPAVLSAIRLTPVSCLRAYEATLLYAVRQTYTYHRYATCLTAIPDLRSRQQCPTYQPSGLRYAESSHHERSRVALE